jgi:hypothetical protein
MASAPAFANTGAPLAEVAAVTVLPVDDGVSERDNRQSGWDRRPWAIELNLGIATPVGVAGLMLDYAPLTSLSLGCGAGTNLFFDTKMHGVEAACMVRFRALSDSQRALALGFGASIGPFLKTEVFAMGTLGPFLGPLTALREGPPPRERVWDAAGWLNFEMGYEKRTLEGVTFRVYVGVAHMLNPEDARPLEPPTDAFDRDRDVVELSTTLMYFGVAPGRAW